MAKSLFSIQRLYQVNPDAKSLKSHQALARKESAILRRNGRMPKHKVLLHFLKEYSPNDITSLRTKIFRYLTKNGIESIATIGLTRNRDDRPNNRVAFHFLTDDPRSSRDLQMFFHYACQVERLVLCIDYWIDYNPVSNPEACFDYFTGYGRTNDMVLFRKDLRIQKFYTIGKWYRKPKRVLWQEAIDCMLKGNSIDPDKSSSQSK